MNFEHFTEIDSTNDEARRRALSGEIGPLWLYADAQTAGKGRRGRRWISADGNLFATGLFTLQASPAEAAQLSFAAALAVADLAQAAAPGAQAALKWPNDVLIEGRKLSGILLESGARPGGGLWLAVGIGINLAHHPEESESPATDLAFHGASITPAEAVRMLADRFEHWKARWAEMGFAPLRDAWLARAHGLGGACEARLDGETVRGVFADLMADGALRLDLPDGRRRFISAGDVFFPGQT